MAVRKETCEQSYEVTVNRQCTLCCTADLLTSEQISHHFSVECKKWRIACPGCRKFDEREVIEGVHQKECEQVTI